MDYADADVRKFVYSRDELAFALGCSVRKVAELMKVPGCPGRLTNGSYPLPAWKKFYREFDPRSAESVRGDGRKAGAAHLARRHVRGGVVGGREALGARFRGVLQGPGGGDVGVDAVEDEGRGENRREKEHDGAGRSS